MRLIGYPIHDWEVEGRRGWKDPALIPWIAEQKLTWITKDDAAKRAHILDIRRQGISVVWVRGMERDKSHISPHELHLMLAVRLLPIARALAKARTPVHHELYCHGDQDTPRVTCGPLNLDRINARSSVRRARLGK